MQEFDSTFVRTPEPEVMEEEEQCDAYANADFSEANESFVAQWRARFPEFRGGRWADFGCGPADIPARICAQFPEVTVLAADASAAMIALAERAINRQNLGERVTLFCGLISDLHGPEGGFDAVISNSLLHHLPDPAIIWKELIRQGKPGAPVMIMDLRRPQTREDAARMVDEYSPNDPEVLRTDFYNSLLAAYTPREVRDQLNAQGLHALEVASISDRHLLAWGRLPA